MTGRARRRARRRARPAARLLLLLLLLPLLLLLGVAAPAPTAAVGATVPAAPRPRDRDAPPPATPGFGAPALGAPAFGAPAVGAPAVADRAVLDRVIAASDVQTGRKPPGVWAYVGHLGRRLFAWIGGGLQSAAAAVALAPALVRIVAWAAAALAAVAAVAAAMALVRRWRRRSGPRAEEPHAVAEPADPPARDAGEWRTEIERRLAAGRIAEALAAVWGWLAGALCGAGAEPSWTGGDLLAHARRPDLAPAVARLDAMTYGPRRPQPAEIRELVGGLDRGLGGRLGGAPAGAEARS